MTPTYYIGNAVLHDAAQALRYEFPEELVELEAELLPENERTADPAAIAMGLVLESGADGARATLTALKEAKQ